MKVGDLVKWRDSITGKTDNILGLVFELDASSGPFEKALVHFVDAYVVWVWVGDLEKL